MQWYSAIIHLTSILNARILVFIKISNRICRLMNPGFAYFMAVTKSGKCVTALAQAECR